VQCRPPDRPRARRPARPPAELQTTTDDADGRRQQTTNASEQNNTGPLGGPVTKYIGGSSTGRSMSIDAKTD